MSGTAMLALLLLMFALADSRFGWALLLAGYVFFALRRTRVEVRREMRGEAVRGQPE
jgi:hypothetical protein